MNPLTEEEKDQLIAEVLVSNKGSIKLGQRLMAIDPIPQGPLPVIEWEPLYVLLDPYNKPPSSVVFDTIWMNIFLSQQE